MHTSFEKSFAHIVHHQTDGTASRAAMELKPKGETLLLRDNDYLHVDRAKGWIVTAMSGTVWITQDGDVRDIVLEAGERFTFDRAGLAIVSAFGEASICIARESGRCAAPRTYGGQVDTGRVVHPAFA